MDTNLAILNEVVLGGRWRNPLSNPASPTRSGDHLHDCVWVREQTRSMRVMNDAFPRRRKRAIGRDDFSSGKRSK
eukprot:2489053-Pyramimonas_sp.AAC.1